jgi:hypothetical protein
MLNDDQYEKWKEYDHYYNNDRGRGNDDASVINNI